MLASITKIHRAVIFDEAWLIDCFVAEVSA
jgi:hypothetical protein